MIRIALYVMAGIAAFVSWAALLLPAAITARKAVAGTGRVPVRVAVIGLLIAAAGALAACILITAAGDLR
jgi:hypothetical protein